MNWVVFTILAAFFQNLRTSLQKKLNKDLSLVASAYVRFAFALPFAFILFFLFHDFNVVSDIINQTNFIFFTFLGSILQVTFTITLLYLFRFSNFVVGTSLSKTEVIQIAIFEYIILKDKSLRKLIFDDLSNVKEEIIFKNKIGRIRDIQVHPDNGKVYFLGEDALWLMEKI